MSLISAHDIEKSYGPHRVLAGVSATLSNGERVGLVGDNGSGKTTLARILGKVEPPDVGTVMQRRGSRIGYLPQVPLLDESLTMLEAATLGLAHWQSVRREYEEINQKLPSAPSDAARQMLIERQSELAAEIERMGGWDQEHRANAILEQLHVANVNAKVGASSGGERRRVALTALLVSEPDVLILDEPTNHLDTDSIDWLETYLEETFKGALLVITHDRYFLDRVVNRTWEMHAGELESYQGGWEAFLTAKAEREAVEARTESNRQNFLRTELEWLRRQPKARGTKQKARIGRAEEALGPGPRVAQGMRIESTSARQGSAVVEFTGLSLRRGEREVIKNLDLIVTPGQRFGVLGPNGAGKTSLLQVITGQLQPTQGKAVLGKNARIGYFAQTRTELDDSATVAENVAERRQQVTVGGHEITIYSYLERFLFRGEEIRKKVGVLSGGERARVALAKLLLQPVNLLLLDEPTNDLDITTMGALEQMLCEFAGSVLVVSHDRYFLDRVATSILAFEGDGHVGHYVGNYTNYTSLRAERAKAKGAAEKAAERAAPLDPAAPERARSVKLTYKEARELSEIEGVIAAAEAEVSRLEQQLADPEIYRRDAPRAQQLANELTAARARVATLLDRWQALETKREASEPKR